MTNMLKTIALVAVLTLLGSAAFGQTFSNNGTTKVAVTIGSEASIRIDTASTTLTEGTGLFADFAGQTNFTYKVRTPKSGGKGDISVQITTDFSPTGGPSVANPPTSGDALTYTCKVTDPAVSCSGTQTASTTAATSVASFGENARSAKPGNGGLVTWGLTNDPLYQTDSYTATATFTISTT